MTQPQARCVLGEQVKRLRQERGIEQNALAYASGISCKTLSDIENAKRNPSLDTIERIASGLGVEVVKLLETNRLAHLDEDAPSVIPTRRSKGMLAEEAVLSAIRRKPNVTVTSLVEITGFGHSTIERAIARLKKKGVLARIGSPREGRWILRDGGAPPDKYA